MSLHVQTLFHNELLPKLTALKTSQISQSKPEVKPWEGGGGGTAIYGLYRYVPL